MQDARPASRPAVAWPGGRAEAPIGQMPRG
jgi:hypothetical protein